MVEEWWRLLARLNPARLEEEYKAREVAQGLRVESPLALRLDGVSWGRRLRGRYRWPRDERVHRAEAHAAVEAVALLGADLGYVTSDEISIVWVSREPPYGGRVEKLDSVAAGAASAHVSLELGAALFYDARVVKLYSARDAALYLLHRARVGMNNYLTSLYHSVAAGRRGETPGLQRVVEELERLGLGPSRLPPWALYGSCVARVPSVKRGPGVEAERRRLAVLPGPGACLEALGVSVEEVLAAGDG